MYPNVIERCLRRAVQRRMECQRFGLIVAKILWRQFAYL